MPPNRSEPESRSLVMLETFVLVQLHSLGTPQKVIARILGKSLTWVNASLKGVPKPRTGA